MVWKYLQHKSYVRPVLTKMIKTGVISYNNIILETYEHE